MPLPRPTNPENTQKTFVIDDDWWLHDPTVSLEYQFVLRVNDQTETPQGVRVTVNLVTDRISIGHFTADSSGLSTVGTYFTRWWCTTADLESGAEVTWDGPDFDILTAGSDFIPGPIYALVSDLRREGVPASNSDARCLRALHIASRYVEVFTGRRFIAEAKTLKLDGFGANSAVLFEDPIIALSRVALVDGEHEPDVSSDISRDTLRIYNRHLKQLLKSPDDRDTPRIELQFEARGIRAHVPRNSGQGMVWPRARQDIIVAGAFGYTDPNGSPMGITPEMIRHATILISLRELPLMADPTARSTATAGIGVKRERTRDQEVEYAVGGGIGARSGSPFLGAFTGDPEIDSLLAFYRRPPRIGAA